MFNSKYCARHITGMLVFCFLLFLPYSLHIQQQIIQPQTHEEGLTLQQILTLIGKVSEEEIITQVKKYKVQFQLTDWRNTAPLVRSGFSNTLLEAIEEFYIDNVSITNFKSWLPSGGVKTTTMDDGSIFIAKGNLTDFSRFTTLSSFNIGNKRILKVKVVGSANSFFTLDKRMLKVLAGANQQTLLCDDISVRTQDPEFICQIDEIFEYTIPDEMVLNGQLHGLCFVFGPGNINDLKISAWFR